MIVCISLSICNVYINIVSGVALWRTIGLMFAFGGFQGGLVLPIGTSPPESLTHRT